MSEPQGDVLVIFGITGDLAKLQTFRSLYRLERRGLLNCPIVGVAVDPWTLPELIQHAHDDIVATGEPLDEAVFARFAVRVSYIAGDFADPTTFQRVKDAIGDAKTPVFYLEVPPFLFATVVARPRRRRRHRQRPHRHREAVRPRPRIGEGAGRRAPRCASTSRSSTASITSSGRWDSPRSCSCGSPTRCSNRSGTATTSGACRSRWPRASASTIEATSTIRSERSATSSSTTSCRSSRRRRWRRRRDTTRRC